MALTIVRQHYVGEIGTSFIIDCEEDISDSTAYSIKYKKPNGTTGIWTAVLHTISGATNYLLHAVASGDFDQAGQYEAQPYVELATWKGRGKTVKFQIYENFS